MEIRLIGPLGKVTGSCTWMRDKARNWNFLVDCGMQQGEATAAQWNSCDWPFVPAELKFVVLTHAHIDHCGLLPVLYKQGFSGTVYSTRETRDLATILLKDAASFPAAPFTVDDVDHIKWHEPESIPLLGGYHPVDNDLFLRFFRSGHIMGAVSVSIYWGPQHDQRSIAFSGDLGPCYEDAEHLPLLRFNMHPKPCDFAVIESTYGGTVRNLEDKDAELRLSRLRALIDRTIDQSGVLMIPAFSLGRTQDVLFDLHWIVAENPSKYQAVNFLFDSPSASNMHQIILDGLSRTEVNGRNGKVRPLWIGKQLFRWLGLDDKDPSHMQKALQIVAMTLGKEPQQSGNKERLGSEVAQAWHPIMQHVKQRSQMLKMERTKPRVIVTSSGTCDGGPAAAWLPNLLGSEINTIALTGYCPPSSVGGQLQSLQNTPLQERARHTGKLQWTSDNSFQMANIRANVTTLIGYSAHADQSGLLDWLFKYHQDKWKLTAPVVFVQHGSNSQRQALEVAALERAANIGQSISMICPNSSDEWFDLDMGGAAVIQEQKRKRLLDEIERIKRELEETVV